jgi:hypothetical protein
MTPPIRRRSLAEIAEQSFGAAPEADPYKPTMPRVASEAAPVASVKAPQRSMRDDAIGAGRQVLQGVSFGFADEVEGAGRAALGPRSYREERDDVRAQNTQFADENPGMALGANIAGGLASGAGLAQLATLPFKGAALLRAAGMGAPSGVGTTASRVGQAMKAGGVAGGLSGAGIAPEAGDMLNYGVAGAAGGAALGGLFTAGASAMSNARNAVASAGLNGAKPNALRRMIQSESPEQSGVRRLLNAAARGGQSADELVAASRNGPASKSLAEFIPDGQGTRITRIARNAGRERDAIDKAFAERTAEAPARYTQTISDITGVPEGLDAKIVGEKAFAAVEPRYAKLVGIAYAQPDASAKPLLSVVEKMSKSKSGNAALTRAKELSEGFDAIQNIDPANPVISVQNAHYLREGIDYAVSEAEKAGDAQMVRILMGERNVVDRFVKRTGGKAMQRADRLWEAAANEGESFAAGQQSQLAKTKPLMVKMKAEAKNPTAFQRGAASKQIEGVESIQDGVAGQTRNPTVGTMGSKTARARSSLAYQTPGEFQQARGAAEDIVSEIATQRGVSGNSTTAANLSEMADEFMSDPALLVQAPLNPIGTMKRMGERGGQMLTSGLNAEQATQVGKLATAGLPGRMSRKEAEAMIEKMAPFIQKQLANQMMRRTAITGGLIRRASPSQQ